MISTDAHDKLASNKKLSKYQNNLETDARHAKFMLEQAARDEFNTQQLNNDINSSNDDNNTGNPFVGGSKRGGEVVELEEQLPQLDWLGKTLDKYVIYVYYICV